MLLLTANEDLAESVHGELLQYVRMLLLVDLIWQLPRRPIRMLGPDLFLDQVDHRLLSNCMVSILLLFASAAFPARDRWARQARGPTRPDRRSKSG